MPQNSVRFHTRPTDQNIKRFYLEDEWRAQPMHASEWVQKSGFKLLQWDTCTSGLPFLWKPCTAFVSVVIISQEHLYLLDKGQVTALTRLPIPYSWCFFLSMFWSNRSLYESCKERQNSLGNNKQAKFQQHWVNEHHLLQECHLVKQNFSWYFISILS